MKGSFYEQMEYASYQSRIQILLGDFNAKVGRVDSLKVTNESGVQQ
jgi:hypothetical protein